MAQEFVRISFDPKANKVDINSTTNDSTMDLRIIIEGLALCMAVNRRNKKINAEAMEEFVRREIHRIANSRNTYKMNEKGNLPPNFLLPR